MTTIRYIAQAINMTTKKKKLRLEGSVHVKGRLNGGWDIDGQDEIKQHTTRTQKRKKNCEPRKILQALPPPWSKFSPQNFAVSVAGGVLGQVVTSHEPPLAQGAFEALLSGVRASVPRQLIGAGEPLGAAGPGAGKRLLSSVRANVRLQVRTLAVDFVAFLVRTPVLPGVTTTAGDCATTGRR